MKLVSLHLLLLDLLHLLSLVLRLRLHCPSGIVVVRHRVLHLLPLLVILRLLTASTLLVGPSLLVSSALVRILLLILGPIATLAAIVVAIAIVVVATLSAVVGVASASSHAAEVSSHLATELIVVATIAKVQQEADRVDQSQEVSVLAANLVHALPLVGALVELLLETDPAGLSWLTEVDDQAAVLERCVRSLLLGISGRLPILEGDEGELRFQAQLRVVHRAEVSKELFEFLPRGGGADVLDHQVQQLHALLELVSTFLQLELPLILALGLAHVEVPFLGAVSFVTIG